MAQPTAISQLRQVTPCFLGIAIWSVGFFLCLFVVPFLPDFSKEIGITFSAGILACLSMVFVIGFSRLNLDRMTYLAIGAVAVAVVFKTATPLVQRAKFLDFSGRIPGSVFFMTINMTQLPVASSEHGIKARNEIYHNVQDFLEKFMPESPFLIFLLGIAQLLVASGVGLWIGLGVDKPGHLLAISIVAGLADIWSVFAGTTAEIVQSSQINYFLIRFPLLSGPAVSMPYLIGLVDFLFFGIFFQAAVRFGLGEKKNVLLLGLSFFLAVFGAVALKVGLPVLPFMAVLFVGGNYREMKLEPQEKRQLFCFLLIVSLIAVILTLK